eukprot:5352408-Ditylum_brightwellii.AAC.1
MKQWNQHLPTPSIIDSNITIIWDLKMVVDVVVEHNLPDIVIVGRKSSDINKWMPWILMTLMLSQHSIRLQTIGTKIAMKNHLKYLGLYVYFGMF